MKPVEFPEQQAIFVGDGVTVLPLPVASYQGMLISCWEVTDEDLERIKDTGRIWVRIHAPVHPPIYLGSEYPFIHPDDEFPDVEFEVED